MKVMFLQETYHRMFVVCFQLILFGCSQIRFLAEERDKT